MILNLFYLLSFCCSFHFVLFLLNLNKRFCLQILSEWAAGQEKKVVLKRDGGGDILVEDGE